VTVDQPIPSKRFGQHFLRDKRIIQRIIDALAPQPDETIIEIGPGAGALTTQLVERAGRIIASSSTTNSPHF
jgi:16S rRNA (adenine1518-N6/adenine1519-N6)-dimethyltransferase